MTILQVAAAVDNKCDAVRYGATNTVLQTKVDAQCDKLIIVVGRRQHF